MSFIVRSAILVIVYLVAAKVGLAFGSVSSSAIIIWPSSGIALAAVLLWGTRYLGAILLAAILTSLMVDVSTYFALGYSIGSVLEAGLGFFLLRHFRSTDISLNRPRDLFEIILLGGLVPPVATAVLGALSLMLAGSLSHELLPEVMWQWWRADVLGIAFFTPIVLVFAQPQSGFFKSSRLQEVGALWVISFFVGQSIFLGWQLPGMSPGQTLDLSWLFPLLLWSGLRAGRRNTALIQLLFMSQILVGSYLQTGYFADDFARYGLSNFWMFAMILAVAGMALAVMSTAQRKAAHMVALNAKVFSVSSDGIVITDENNHIVEVNPAFTALTGYPRDEVLGKNPRLLSSGKQSREFFESMWKTLQEQGCWKGELWNRRKDGQAFLEELSIYCIKDETGKVINRVGVFSDVTQIRAEQETVAHHAQHDFLTNLPNRMLFGDRFAQQIAWARRHKKKFAVMYIDLDKFKQVNDTLGHQVGDQLLISVGVRLKTQVREIDTVSRFGGDEFAVLMSEITDVNDVTQLAEKIMMALSLPYQIEGHTVHSSGSLGIAIYPDDGEDLDTILSKADKSMYSAKRGRSLIFGTL